MYQEPVVLGVIHTRNEMVIPERKLVNDYEPFMKQCILCSCSLQHWNAPLKQLPSTLESV